MTERISSAFDSTALRNMQQSVKDLAVISQRLVKFAGAQTGRIDTIATNVANTSTSFAGVAHTFEIAAARLDTATADNQIKDILDNSRASSADLRQASADLRSLAQAARENQSSLVRALTTADTLLARIQDGRGTLGMMAGDSTLYIETTRTIIQMRELLGDIQQNPKKYFKVSVF